MSNSDLFYYFMSAVCGGFIIALIKDGLAGNLRDLRKDFVRSMRALFGRKR